MERLVRFGVSLENELLKQFDADIKKKNYPNRSEAIRDLIRESLVKEEWVKGGEIAGAITLVYNHHRRELVNKLTNIQHAYYQLIISVQHIHLDEDNCLEIVVVKGKVNMVRKLADQLRATKGVKHTALTMSTTGKEVK